VRRWLQFRHDRHDSHRALEAQRVSRGDWASRGRCLNPAYHLVQGSAAARDLWTSDSVYTALHDPVLLDRARRRFEWANKAEYAGLWLGTGTRLEANVGNGLVDWRDGDNYAHKAENWQRFVDTSAYFIGMTLRVCYGRDTKLVPE